jgi:protein-tyrosine phosphatase
VIDLHCHILPGIDDGPATMRDSLAMCSQMVSDGTDVVVATPHMLNGNYSVSRADILRGVLLLKEELSRWSIPLDVRPGADVMISSDLAELLRKGLVMTVGDAGKYILLELPHDVIPGGLDELLYEVQMLGITPIISHPERQFELQRHPDLLRPLIGRGSLLQVTAASLEGKFGDSAQKCSLFLLKQGLVHLCASDAHSARGRKPGLSRARKIVEELLSVEEARRIFDVNPARVLTGAYIEPSREEPVAAAKAGKIFFWRR